MQFRPLSSPPKRFTPCLVRRDLNVPLEINGVVQHGLTERRSEFVITFFSGSHWLGREAHWAEWVEIPAENTSQWQIASLFAPENLKPVIVILPQPVFLRSIVIQSGLHFGFYSDNGEKTWKVFQRNQGARITPNDELITNRCWIDIGYKQVSSWLEIPNIRLNGKLREFRS